MVRENGTDREKVPKSFQLGAVLTFFVLLCATDCCPALFEITEHTKILIPDPC